MSEPVDAITPKYYPEGLVVDIEEHAKGAKAIAVVIISKDDEIWIDCCGHDKHAILWGLRKLELRLMGVKDDG